MTALAAVLVVATLAAMASNRVDPVVALLVALVFAGVVGLAEPQALAAGLSNAGVITVAGMLVIAQGIVQTGVVARVTWGLLAATKTARGALGRLSLPIGVGSALINTTPLVAMLIPATRQLEQTRRIPAREVLLPIAHITTLAGSVTLIGTSSNLVIAGLADERGVGMSMLSFAPVALPVAIVGGVVIFLTASRTLRGTTAHERQEKEWRVEIPVASAALATDRRAADLGIARTREYELTSIRRWGTNQAPDTPIEAGDVLVFDATEGGVSALWEVPLFGLSAHKLFAVSVSAGEGATLHDFERDGSLRIIAARTREPLHETRLDPGETCFVSADDRTAVARNPAVALWQDVAYRAPQPAKTGIALAILATVIVAASFGLAPAELAASGGATLMVITGVISPRSAANALQPKVLALLAGSIGLGAVVVSSGLAGRIADAIGGLSDGRLGTLIVLAVVTTVLTNLVTNAATASILTPVAISVAREAGIDPTTTLALLGTCVSLTLLNPFSHQSNVMVMRPGGYTGAVFARFGMPVLVACLAAACGVAYALS
ncbi:citrate transporter [Solirubrobacter pauli]|uniref:Citrate transporter n=1 Tax=Solirubrobacter pauli TaxID=166793 RepID=A0A660LC20_9ACTN|nr:SLC13 family permease [Solirubrobacter pauli]RKQ92129.1 citrate transporter [Solirubrobacter pauli]